MILFEDEIIQKRLAAFRKKLQEKGLDAGYITKRENYIYLSGFTGSSAFLLITQNEAVLITDSRYAEQAEMQCPAYKIVVYTASLLEEINRLIISLGIIRLGFEETDLSFADYSRYSNKLICKEFIPMDSIIEKLRMVKDSVELDIIKNAVEIADKAFEHILPFVRPGITEIDIAAELEHEMKRLGAKGPSFDTIAASGLRSSMPHGVASEKTIEKGDCITFDFGALYKEYCSDMTRTVFVGEPSPEMRKIYNTVLSAQLKAIEGAKAGLRGKDVDKIARDFIADNGYGDYFGHGLGHSVGLEIHESPRFSKSCDDVLEDNMVITVEPGIYIPGLGGVRIEDIILINGNQPLILTSSTKDIIIL
jgi:Xaa-Pro aminopeptidase